MIGNNQNFLRSFMKAHSSLKNSLTDIPPGELKLTFHMRGWTRLPHEAIRIGLWHQSTMHRIPTKQAHDQTHRRNQAIKYYSENYSRVDPAQSVTNDHPYLMNPLQTPRQAKPQDNQQYAWD
jgi:hypothetical protein